MLRQISVFAACATALTVGPVQASDSRETALAAAVKLWGSNNNALTLAVRPGNVDIVLNLQVLTPVVGQAALSITNLSSQTPPADVVRTSVVVGPNAVAANADGASSPTSIVLTLNAPEPIRIVLRAPGLRPATTYKATLLLQVAGQSLQWELAFVTGPAAVLAAAGSPVVVRFATYPFGEWRSDTEIGSIPITLYDKSTGGPFTNVRVRLEQPQPLPAGAVTSSNLSIDSFSFAERTAMSFVPLDLARFEAHVRPTNSDVRVASTDQRESAVKTVVDQRGTRTVGRTTPAEGRVGDDLNVPFRDERTVIAKVEYLTPGEYSGTLRFSADETATDNVDGGVSITILVRHHWIFPVLVLIFGSAIGWYSSKYIVAMRTARVLARDVRRLRDRADSLARADGPRAGWRFAGEATSLALIRVTVALSQLSQLTSSATAILLGREDDIRQSLKDADQRLTLLEAFRTTRIDVQRVADGRPAAQLALGRLLRKALDSLARPAFGDQQIADVNSAIQEVRAWLAPATFNDKYLGAVVDRRNSTDVPDATTVQSYEPGHLQLALQTSLAACPLATLTSDPPPPLNALQAYDLELAKLVLLWRERNMEWADDLATAYSQSSDLDHLFRLADDKIWKALSAAAKADQLRVHRDPPDDASVETFDLVYLEFESDAPHIPNWRINYHPLRIAWHVNPPGGAQRDEETDGLTLPQFFNSAGPAKIHAQLRWQGDKIDVPGDVVVKVVPNPDYRGFGVGGFAEMSAVVVAIGFAVATAMSTQYNWTFGSFGDYLKIFLWAAGTGTGGNLFKQLGTSSTPGGQADITLPALSASAAGGH
jgi:hypothetical protein